MVTVNCNVYSKTTNLKPVTTNKDQVKRGLDGFGYGAPLNDWSGISKFLEWNPSAWTPDGYKHINFIQIFFIRLIQNLLQYQTNRTNSS